MNIANKIKDWLLPAGLIVFLLEIILVPFSVQFTYADRRESPDHVLTYTVNQLTWDSTTDVDAQTGAAELSLFNSTYQNVEADNGDKVIAPGTEGKNFIRLKNDSGAAITYIAVMYHIKKEPALPVEPVFVNSASFTDTWNYPLPEGVEQKQVIRAVKGTVNASQAQDFEIVWMWEYYKNDERDGVDTELGNRAARHIPDEITAGLYIVVEKESGSGSHSESGSADKGGSDDSYAAGDPGEPGETSNLPAFSGWEDLYIYPELPKTGDTTNVMLYRMLMTIGCVLLFLILPEWRKEKR